MTRTPDLSSASTAIAFLTTVNLHMLYQRVLRHPSRTSIAGGPIENPGTRLQSWLVPLGLQASQPRKNSRHGKACGKHEQGTARHEPPPARFAASRAPPSTTTPPH